MAGLGGVFRSNWDTENARSRSTRGGHGMARGLWVEVLQFAAFPIELEIELN